MKKFIALLLTILLLVPSLDAKKKSKKSTSSKKSSVSYKYKKKHSRTHSRKKSKKKKRTRYTYVDPLKYKRKTKIPTSFEELIFRGRGYVIKIRAKQFRQVNLAFLRIYSNNPECRLDISQYRILWRNTQISLSPTRKGYIGIVPIHPEQKVGLNDLVVHRKSKTKSTTETFSINIRDTQFPVRKMYSRLRVPKKYVPRGYSAETQRFIEKCDLKKQKAFSTISDMQISGRFVSPVNTLFVTSPFYTKRYYHPKRKGKPHGGVDLRGKIGFPIYAIQNGKVLISERMFFEGIFTVIDHGSQMFSLYMHQSKTLVKEGDFVKKGTKIGEIGSTGVSTGPHLHLGLRVDGVMINPLSVLEVSLY